MSGVIGRKVTGWKIRSGREYEVAVNSKHIYCLRYLASVGPTTYHDMVYSTGPKGSHQLGARMSELSSCGLIRTKNLSRAGYLGTITNFGRELLAEHEELVST